MARYLILDAEAVSALARAGQDPKAARRAQAVLTSAYRAGALVRVPAAALVEVYRGRRSDTAIDAALGRVARVVPMTHAIARRAGALLAARRLDSSHAVDATVVATAIRLGGGVIATHDPKDIRRLAAGHDNVKVFAI